MKHLRDVYKIILPLFIAYKIFDVEMKINWPKINKIHSPNKVQRAWDWQTEILRETLKNWFVRGSDIIETQLNDGLII